jgi:hypothetical protein
MIAIVVQNPTAETTVVALTIAVDLHMTTDAVIVIHLLTLTGVDRHHVKSIAALQNLTIVGQMTALLPRTVILIVQSTVIVARPHGTLAIAVMSLVILWITVVMSHGIPIAIAGLHPELCPLVDTWNPADDAGRV